MCVFARAETQSRFGKAQIAPFHHHTFVTAFNRENLHERKIISSKNLFFFRSKYKSLIIFNKIMKLCKCVCVCAAVIRKWFCRNRGSRNFLFLRAFSLINYTCLNFLYTIALGVTFVSFIKSLFHFFHSLSLSLPPERISV